MANDHTRKRLESAKIIVKNFKEINPKFDDVTALADIQRLMDAEDDAPPQAAEINPNLIIKVSKFMLEQLEDELTEPNMSPDKTKKIKDQINYLNELLRSLSLPLKQRPILKKEVISKLFEPYRRLRSANKANVVIDRLIQTMKLIRLISNLNIKDEHRFLKEIEEINAIKRKLKTKVDPANEENLRSQSILKDVAVAAIDSMIVELTKRKIPRPGILGFIDNIVGQDSLSISSLESLLKAIEQGGKVDMLKMDELLQKYVLQIPASSESPPDIPAITTKTETIDFTSRKMSKARVVKIADEPPKPVLKVDPTADQSQKITELKHQSEGLITKIQSLQNEIEDFNRYLQTLADDKGSKITRLLESSRSILTSAPIALSDYDRMEDKIKVEHPEKQLSIDSLKAKVAILTNYRDTLISLRDPLKANVNLMQQEIESRNEITAIAHKLIVEIGQLSNCQGCSKALKDIILSATSSLNFIITTEMKESTHRNWHEIRKIKSEVYRQLKEDNQAQMNIIESVEQQLSDLSDKMHILASESNQLIESRIKKIRSDLKQLQPTTDNIPIVINAEILSRISNEIKSCNDHVKNSTKAKVDQMTHKLNELIHGVETLSRRDQRLLFNNSLYPEWNTNELLRQLQKLPTFDQSTKIKEIQYYNLVLGLEKKISVVASKANPFIELKTRQETEETRVVQDLIQKLNDQMQKVGAADPRYTLLSGMKDALTQNLNTYLENLSSLKHAFLFSSINAIGEHLTEEKLSSLSQYPKLIEPFVSFVRNLLTPLVKWFTGKTYQSGFFASKTEVVVADLAEKAHQSLSAIQLNLDQVSNAAGVVVSSANPHR